MPSGSARALPLATPTIADAAGGRSKPGQHLEMSPAKWRLGLEHRLMKIVVEFLALGVDALHAVTLERGQQFALSRCDPVEQAARAIILGLGLRQAVERAPQIVGDRQ